jgi:GNAT superfamily N-acetyltransferase
VVDVAEGVLKGQAEWFRLLADRGCPHLQADAALAVTSGLFSNTENGIVVSSRAAATLETVIELVRWVTERHVPASLVLTDVVGDDVVECLIDAGLTPENAGHEMGMPLVPDALPAFSVNRNVDIREVSDELTLCDGLRVLDEDGWFDEPGEYERRRVVAARVGYGAGSPVRHWVAYRGSRPVGMATSFRFCDTVVLAHCCVAEDQRRRGIGTALTSARLEAAYRSAARLAVLSPSPDGYELHRSLGFTLVDSPQDRWFYLPYPNQ